MKFKLAFAAAALAASGLAHSATYDWTVWSTGAPPPDVTATGTAGTVGISYTGIGSYESDVPLWGSDPSWQGGNVANAPTDANGIIHMIGGDSTVSTITFSQSVTNPVIAIWSLGGGSTSASFVFDETPTFESGGGNHPYGGGAVTVDGDTVSGVEGNGNVEFMGTFTSISWTNPQAENWYGFTVGVSAVPEPGSMGLLLAGLTLVGLAARRRQKR